VPQAQQGPGKRNPPAAGLTPLTVSRAASDQLILATAPAGGAPLVYRLKINGHSILAMLDSGATDSFVRDTVPAKLGLRTVTKDRPDSIGVADGSTMLSTQVVHMPYAFDAFVRTELFHVCPLSDKLPVDAILGRKWLLRHNPDIDWKTGIMNIRMQRSGGGQEQVLPEQPPTDPSPFLLSALQFRHATAEPEAQVFGVYLTALEEEEPHDASQPKDESWEKSVKSVLARSDL
jgi:hypothetical protein